MHFELYTEISTAVNSCQIKQAKEDKNSASRLYINEVFEMIIIKYLSLK